MRFLIPRLSHSASSCRDSYLEGAPRCSSRLRALYLDAGLRSRVCSRFTLHIKSCLFWKFEESTFLAFSFMPGPGAGPTLASSVRRAQVGSILPFPFLNFHLSAIIAGLCGACEVIEHSASSWNFLEVPIHCICCKRYTYAHLKQSRGHSPLFANYVVIYLKNSMKMNRKKLKLLTLLRHMSWAIVKKKNWNRAFLLSTNTISLKNNFLDIKK